MSSSRASIRSIGAQVTCCTTGSGAPGIAPVMPGSGLISGIGPDTTSGTIVPAVSSDAFTTAGSWPSSTTNGWSAVAVTDPASRTCTSNPAPR